MLLCDAAQSVGGKLYILGGGWTQVAVGPGLAVPMALAIRVRIPWDQANERFALHAVLTDADGEPANVQGNRIEGGGEIEVGRPPGVERGSPLDAMLALNFPPLPLFPGTYVWLLEINGEPRARARFKVTQ
ncbi:MAG: hypothetical protein QOJ29_2640 [Thermoleophilaceae bacterium]|jgi:hypothetical protein|nr:hypothetical protein [Thermoleophilaceae bacterium]